MPTPTLRPTATPASSALLDRYRTVRAASLALTAPLSPEDLMVQSCPEASPAKWHLAHTSWFFETFVLREFLPAYQDFHPDFHWLFNSYYNSLGDMPAKSKFETTCHSSVCSAMCRDHRRVRTIAQRVQRARRARAPRVDVSLLAVRGRSHHAVTSEV